MSHLPSIASKRKRKVRDQPPGRRLQRGRGQAAAEVRLVELDHPQTDGLRVVAQPSEIQLVGYGQQDNDVRGQVPATEESGMGKCEAELMMRGTLTAVRMPPPRNGS